MGDEIEAEVGVTPPGVVMIASSIFTCYVTGRWLARGRSNSTLPTVKTRRRAPCVLYAMRVSRFLIFIRPRFRLMLICNRSVYENNGRILKCGHEVCAGESGRPRSMTRISHCSSTVRQIVWRISASRRSSTMESSASVMKSKTYRQKRHLRKRPPRVSAHVRPCPFMFMSEQAADVGILRSDMQEDDRHQPERHLPL